MEAEMRRKVVCAACGVLCALCVVAYTQSVRGEIEQAQSEALAQFGGEQVEVCVAARDIAAGETITDSSITMKRWIAGLLPSGALTKASEAVGKQATSPILAGEVVSSRRFSALSSSIEVPAGLVAVSVSAKDVRAVGGALMPGSKVDVYATGNASTEVIGKNVLVLATSAHDSDGSSSGASLTWVALAVQPSAVQELIAAEQKTQLYFALPGASSSEAGDSHEAK